jgi:hypothetical protein
MPPKVTLTVFYRTLNVEGLEIFARLGSSPRPPTYAVTISKIRASSKSDA